VGLGEYLEDLVARVDAPLLVKLEITFFHQLIFNTPQLARFISRTPKFMAHDEVHVFFHDWNVWVRLPHAFDGALELGISCRQPDWQLSSLAQVCSSSFPQALVPMLKHLYIHCVLYAHSLDYSDNVRWLNVENSQWLELLRPFTAVKSLYIAHSFVPCIAPALQELVGERVTEVLPALQSLFLEVPPWALSDSQERFGQFVAARQLSSHPIAVSRWERE
jgi:hypothetical protein